MHEGIVGSFEGYPVKAHLVYGYEGGFDPERGPIAATSD
jgi:hypothetical protein